MNATVLVVGFLNSQTIVLTNLYKMAIKYRRSNGKFVKKKTVAKELKCVAAMLKVKNKNKLEDCSKEIKFDVNRVVNLSTLGENLKCINCKNVLSLQNIDSEKRFGLHSIFLINCSDCNIKTAVHTGKTQKCNGETYANNNLSLVLGKFYIKIFLWKKTLIIMKNLNYINN